MLQPKPLQDLLAQALSSDIHTAVLATPQGTLLAHAVNSPSNGLSHGEGPRRQARSLAAIANVIWKSYSNIRNIDELWDTPNGDSIESKNGLLWTAVDCEVVSYGRVVLIVGWTITSLSSAVVVVQGTSTCICWCERCTAGNDADQGIW